MSARNFIILALGTLCLAGCLSPVRQDVDALVCKRAEQSLDEPPPGFLEPRKETKPPAPIDTKKPPTLLERLEVPANVPGSEAPKLTWPKNFLKLSDKEKAKVTEKIVAKHFPPQLEMGADPKPVPGPEGRPLTLADLQKLARENSPLLRQAASDIKAAEGAMIQAAVYNNPVLAYTSSAQSLTNGSIMGPTISETIVTMGKRKLAQAAAKMGLENAKLAYRRAETDLMASVRSAYFAVLVGLEEMKANRALMELTDQVYKVILIQLKQGQVAGYEPAQVSVYAGQARIAYIQARNDYLQAWKNLATAIGLPMMPATELSGNVTRNLFRFDFDKALAYILQNHTDARTALNGIEMARFNLRLAQVTGVPDVTLGAGFLWDTTTPTPSRLVPLVAVASVPLPMFDRNQGGIRQAQGALLRAVEEPHRVQNDLTARFADAYRRLEENRQILELYYKQLLPQQVRAFRATVLRHYAVGPVEVTILGSSTSYLTDLIAAEQNLVSLIASYLTSLGNYWQAASDTASLLQTDDVYQMASDVTQLPAMDLAQLLSLPCCHPCSSLPVVPGVGPAVGPQLPAPPQTLPTLEVPAPQTLPAPRPLGLAPTHPSLEAPISLPDNRTEEAFEGGTP